MTDGALTGRFLDELDQWLAPVDVALARRYPGEPADRQPVHTVYVPADRFGRDTVVEWGAAAVAALAEHTPSPALLPR